MLWKLQQYLYNSFLAFQSGVEKDLGPVLSLTRETNGLQIYAKYFAQIHCI